QEKVDLPLVTTKDMEKAMGLDKEGFRNRFFSTLPHTTGDQLLTKIFSVFNQRIPELGWLLYPGVEKGLHQLSASHGLYIVSNCQEGYLQAFNQCTGLVDRYIQDFEYIGRSGKPKFQNIIDVIDRNRLQSPIYIGDTQGDFDAAFKAGVDFGFAAYGLGQVNRPTISFANFEALVEFLQI
ncbi:MAG: HAD family hydrolase, partial [Bdellovibrionales bacterium]|nr:HAD family hydrolase [Bdellovibrionales bacterium]